MTEVVNMVLGLAVGVLVVGGALVWAMWPRRLRKNSRLAPPSGRENYPDPNNESHY